MAAKAVIHFWAASNDFWLSTGYCGRQLWSSPFCRLTQFCDPQRIADIKRSIATSTLTGRFSTLVCFVNSPSDHDLSGGNWTTI
jgi:hypothetical protein